MAGEIIAKRHAQAVFQIALERGELEKWRSDLTLLGQVFSDPEVVTHLDDPKVKFEDKKKVIARALPHLSGLALNLVYLLILRRRVRVMPQLAEEYGRLVDRRQGIEHAEVTTAAPIDESVKGRFLDELAKITGRKIVLSTKTDPGIIGGFVARVGDKVIDGSVRTRLEKLKKELAQAA
ncbi:MAG: ATP synthase F1 subunit delta [Chloroflexi bacterium]|nr:ATP synthase F1 subunit delta [Chloroflexota bacterium]